MTRFGLANRPHAHTSLSAVPARSARQGLPASAGQVKDIARHKLYGTPNSASNRYSPSNTRDEEQEPGWIIEKSSK